MPRTVPDGPPPRVRDRIRQAAHLRANGAAWAAVAAELGVTADTARAWERKYPAAWRTAERAAAARVLAEATAEAVLTLRKHLRSDDEKASRDAATKLVQFAARVWRARPRAAGKNRPAATVAGAFAAMEGMTDDQLDAFIAEVLPAHDARHDGFDRTLDARRPPGPA